MIRRVKIPTITTAGADGSATGTGQTPAPVVGRVLAVHIDYSAGQEATTDVTIATVETPTVTVFAKADSDTDTWYYPRTKIQDDAGADVTYDGTNEVYEAVAVADYLKATIAQADNGETVNITIVYEE